MKTYEEYVLDEECESINEGIASFIRNKLNNRKNGRTVVEPGFSAADKQAGKEPKTFNITADYRELKTAVLKLGELLTKGYYDKALELAKEIKSDKISNNISALIKGQAKIKELKGQNNDDDVDGDELAANMSSIKTEKKAKRACFSY